MYWSAAFWTMGRTVVEPLILMVCFWPDDTGAAVVTGAAAVAAGAAVVTTTVGDAMGAWVATGVFVPLPVQPAKSIAKMSNAARLIVTSKYELLFDFIVFYHHFAWAIKPFFAINYTSIYTRNRQIE
jgi:hypothetical protein